MTRVIMFFQGFTKTYVKQSDLCFYSNSTQNITTIEVKSNCGSQFSYFNFKM